MLALPPQRRRGDDGRKTAEEEVEEEEFPVGSDEYHRFVDFGDGNLLDCIDFDDLFVEVEGEGELLPGLEMVDCDIAAEFPATSGRKALEMNVSESEVAERAGNGASVNGQDEDKDKSVSRRNESGPVDVVGTKGADRGGGGGKKSSSVQSKISPPQGKRKAKVNLRVLSQRDDEFDPFVAASFLYGFRARDIDICLYGTSLLIMSEGGLDSGPAQEVRAGSGAAGPRQGCSFQDSRDYGNRVSHSPQHR